MISLDNVATIDRSALGPVIGYLTPAQEAALARAIVSAYDLEV